jgi:hypothetical protein
MAGARYERLTLRRAQGEDVALPQEKALMLSLSKHEDNPTRRQELAGSPFDGLRVRMLCMHKMKTLMLSLSKHEARPTLA